MKMFILNDKGTKILIFPYICFPERKEIRKKQLSMKIVADSAIPFLQGVLEPWAEVRYLPGCYLSEVQLYVAPAPPRCAVAFVGLTTAHRLRR